MAVARKADRFGNLAAARVTETAANTLTYAELQTGISLGQGTGILIDRIDYNVDEGSVNNMTGASDIAYFAWCTSNAPTSLAIDDRRIIHLGLLQAQINGTPANNNMIIQPFSFSFSPALIVAAPRLYLAAQGSSLGAAMTVRSRFYFRYVSLTSQEYLELAETFILVG